MIYLFIILGVLVLFVLVGLILPSQFSVSCSEQINAPRERVHALIADLDQWEHWEPWREKDPTITVQRSDQTAGVGAHQTWTDKSGGGELTFTRSDPDYGIDYDLVFAKQHACKASMAHEPVAGDQVRVTWSMTGSAKMPVVGGYFARLLPLMIRPMFTRGLTNLKSVAETK